MPFHRLTVPSYFGGLPGTHDYINSPSLNGDPGSSAPADAKKASGVNQGSYFVTFGEAATSSDVNRPAHALSENTDYLDDAVHRDFAQPVVSATVTPGSPVASFVITGSVYVGAPGVTNDQRTRSGMVAITDGNGQPLTILSGGVYVAVKASLIHDGASNNVLGNNFYTNPTVNVSPSIPAAQAYRVVSYQHSSLIAVDQGALSRFNDGVAGAEDLWAFARTLDVTVPKLASNNTFTGKQIFAFPPVDQPLLSDTIYSSTRKQIWESQISTSPAVYMRMYTAHDISGSGLGGGFELTINARWNNTAANWVADSTTVPAIKYATSNVLATGAVKYTMLAAPVAATFTDFTFSTGPSRYTHLASGIRALHGDAASILLTLDDDLIASYLGNHYKQLLKLTSTSTNAGPPGIYATAIGDANSSDDYGVAITNNAVWDSTAQQWSPPKPSQQSSKLLFTPNGLKFQVKAAPGAAFADSAWAETVELVPSTSSVGDIEYKTAVGRTKIINVYSGMTGDDSSLKWTVGGSVTVAGIFTASNLAWVYFPLDLPFGSTVTRIRALLSPGTSDPMSLVCGVRGTLGFSLGPVSAPTNTTFGTAITASSGAQVLGLTFSSFSITDHATSYYLAVQSSDTASTATDFLYAIQVLYTDFSPAGR